MEFLAILSVGEGHETSREFSDVMSRNAESKLVDVFNHHGTVPAL
jgi:hypothetical protein